MTFNFMKDDLYLAYEVCSEKVENLFNDSVNEKDFEQKKMIYFEENIEK